MHANEEQSITNIIATMRRDLPICSDYDEDFFDDFGEFEEFDDDNDAARPEETKTTPIHSENWTIVDAFNWEVI